MRILIVAPLYPPDTGRLATYIKELAARLALHHRVGVVIYGSHPELVPKVEMTCTGKHWPVFVRTLLFTWRLWRSARDADLLYVSDGASVGAPSVLVSKLRTIPIYRFVREDEAHERLEQLTRTSIPEETFAFSSVSPWKIRFIRFLQRWVLQRAKHMFIPTGWLKDIFSRAYQVPQTKMTVLPYPPERLETVPLPLEPQPHQLLVISQLTHASGVRELIDIFPRLQQEIPDLTLVIANDGPEEASLRGQIESSGLASVVRLLGKTSQAERVYLLQTSGALVLHTNGYNAPHDLYAAYTAQLPVVTIDTLDTLPQVLDDQELRTQLIHQGTLALQNQASWEHHLQTILAV